MIWQEYKMNRGFWEVKLQSKHKDRIDSYRKTNREFYQNQLHFSPLPKNVPIPLKLTTQSGETDQ
jgi:hypothetical protein